MNLIYQKLPFLIELFFNGIFILIYSLKTLDKIPTGWNPEYIEMYLQAATWIIPFVLFFTVVVNYMTSKGVEDFFRKQIFSLIVFIPVVITWGDTEFAFWLASAHLLSTVLSLYDDDQAKEVKRKSLSNRNSLLATLSLKPAQMVLFSFSAVILVGTFLLMLPISTIAENSLSFADALFMATSATCVTGLATVSVGSQFSLFGQIVILLLIQIGGLSIMTLWSVMTIVIGKYIGIKGQLIMQDFLDVSSLEDLFSMIVDILKYTFIIELWGGILLTIAFTFEGFEFGTALYYGIFHSISAFCNAGFSLFDTSLESYATNPLINFIVIVLIVLGGLGFIVLKDLRLFVVGKKSFVRMGAHTKIVLVTTGVLTLAGALFIFFGEFLGALDSYSVFDKIQIALFQSVTLRTAGFNTINFSNLQPYTLYLMTLFMFIGGSPGSTAGGIKTTTLAILLQSIRSTLKGEKDVNIYDRVVSSKLVVRTIAITFISILIASFFILVMMKLEPEQSFLAIFFEVISASGTVGVSLGITPLLSLAGKFSVSLLMLIGRIGPLTLLLAIGQRQKYSGKFSYPEGRIMIG